MGFRGGILPVSDKGSRGQRADTSGGAIRELLAGLEAQVERYEVVPDEQDVIAGRLRGWAGEGRLGLILTRGGGGARPWPRSCRCCLMPWRLCGARWETTWRRRKGFSRALRKGRRQREG